MPDHDEHLPEPIAAYVPQAGRQLQRRLFQLLIEKADQDLVFPRRHGQAGQGIQRRGTRPSTFKTTFGEVTGARSRISHQYEGAREIPWATAGNTPHRLAITQNLGDPVCDPMLDRSARQSRANIGQRGGAEDVLGRRTIVAIGPQEGEQLITAQRPRARALLDDVPEDPWAWLGVSAEDTWVELPDDVPPGDDPEAADAAWEQVPGEWAARGFPGCEPAFPGPAGQPRDVDPGDVRGQPDEVKTQAQPAPGRKEVWTFPAVVLVAGLQDALAASTAETLGFPVAALLVPWGVLSGARRLLVLGDGAAWIRPWFESWGVGPRR
ncbi:MAG TPA: hypothetical protein VKP69_22540 [Isosphaeraceae bacterium]|nr:hypothetical protein [Isosphaeraceae bacterium]